MTFAKTLSGMESRERARFILDVLAAEDEEAVLLLNDALDTMGAEDVLIELDTLAEARTREDPEAEAMVFRWVRVAMCAPLSVG